MEEDEDEEKEDEEEENALDEAMLEEEDEEEEKDDSSLVLEAEEVELSLKEVAELSAAEREEKLELDLLASVQALKRRAASSKKRERNFFMDFYLKDFRKERKEETQLAVKTLGQPHW